MKHQNLIKAAVGLAESGVTALSNYLSGYSDLVYNAFRNSGRM